MEVAADDRQVISMSHQGKDWSSVVHFISAFDIFNIFDICSIFNIFNLVIFKGVNETFQKGQQTQALSTLTGLSVFTQSTKFVETSVSLSQNVGNLGKKERRLLDKMLFHLDFFREGSCVQRFPGMPAVFFFSNTFFSTVPKQC